MTSDRLCVSQITRCTVSGGADSEVSSPALGRSGESQQPQRDLD